MMDDQYIGELACQGVLLFDLDGVLLSEQPYLDAAALTIAAHAPKWAAESHAKQVVRSRLDVLRLRTRYLPAEVIALLRARSLNSNWDKAFACILALYSRTDKCTDCDDLAAWMITTLERVTGAGPEFLRQLQINAVQAPSFSDVQNSFQRFFLGSESADSDLLRVGLSASEPLLQDSLTLHKLLKELQMAGWQLGIGTGRPRAEAQRPLQAAGLWSYFQADRICTFDEVQQAEREQGLPFGALAKPHPYTYASRVVGVKGTHVWVIGDSPADALAAKAAGFHFIGVGDAQELGHHHSLTAPVISEVLELPNCLTSEMNTSA